MKLMTNSPSLGGSMSTQHNIEIWHQNEIKWHKKTLVWSDIPLTKTQTNPVGLSPWSSEVTSQTKQLPYPVGNKEVSKLYHSPWVPVGSPGVNP